MGPEGGQRWGWRGEMGGKEGNDGSGGVVGSGALCGEMGSGGHKWVPGGKRCGVWGPVGFEGTLLRSVLGNVGVRA